MTPFAIRRKTITCLALIFICWLLGFAWFMQQIPRQQADFSDNSADAIVVLTGGGGRLEYGLQLLAENKAQTMFISGVGENLKIKDIFHIDHTNFNKELSEKIFLGHSAKNTIGNSQETIKWLNTMNYHKILLVTSDYHIPRAMLEFSEISPELTIIPAPVLVGDALADEKGLTISEYNKYLASKLRHLFVSVTGKK